MKKFLMFFLSVCLVTGAIPMSLIYADSKDTVDLTADSVLDSYAIKADATFSDSGSFTIKGSCSNSGKSFYSFTVDTTAGLTLSKTENSVQTSLESISVADAYKNGMLVIPNEKYTAILQNHKGQIKCL
ncbi:MAG: hypothetical protein IJ300_14330, partial [Clostridia bacterium]|nr:hypothetical protein [Clostridia bacterium]